jgi:hypothetical protein
VTTFTSPTEHAGAPDFARLQIDPLGSDLRLVLINAHHDRHLNEPSFLSAPRRVQDPAPDRSNTFVGGRRLLLNGRPRGTATERAYLCLFDKKVCLFDTKARPPATVARLTRRPGKQPGTWHLSYLVNASGQRSKPTTSMTRSARQTSTTAGRDDIDLT